MGRNGGKKISAFFGPSEVICRTDLEDRDRLIGELLGRLARKRPAAGRGDVLEAILARERESSSTAIPGIALPHLRLEDLDEVAIGVATSERGIEYAPGISPVRAVVLALIPKSDPEGYLQIQSSLARTFGEAGAVERLAGARTPEEVWRFFQGGAASLPGCICAGDLMETEFVSLRDTDPLERAIDLFDRHGLAEFPVLDKDGELVGVVSSIQLLRACLPDHLLWMEDLSPILHFEPFAQVLKNERKAWLLEIMSPDYATVPEEVPAIQVAKEIVKRNVRQVYVMRGKKLAGVITLERFVRKLLRE